MLFILGGSSSCEPSALASPLSSPLSSGMESSCNGVQQQGQGYYIGNDG